MMNSAGGLAAAVSTRINQLYLQSYPDSLPIAVSLPMDGFHLTRAQLAAMPDPVEATHRRGAAFTFDADGFLDLIQALAATPRRTVLAPAFDHAVKDPVPDGIVVGAELRVVLVEGNYCSLNRGPWRTAALMMDELWYVNVPPEVAHGRLSKRHVESGIVAGEQEAWERATGTDEMNALDIRENRLPSDETIVMA